VHKLVREVGYQSACGVKQAMSARTDDRFALARIMVPYTTDTDLAGFARLLAGTGLPVAPSRRRLGTRGWRLARRASLLLKGPSYSVTKKYIVNPEVGSDVSVGDPISSPAHDRFGNQP
ncbi:MAG: hypothetical protein ACRDGS_10905, partial [Chloroflexota bacterium]